MESSNLFIFLVICASFATNHCVAGNCANNWEGKNTCAALTDANVHQAIQAVLRDGSSATTPPFLHPTFGPIAEWKTQKLTNLACFFSYPTPECTSVILTKGGDKYFTENNRKDKIIQFNADLSKWDVSGCEAGIETEDDIAFPGSMYATFSGAIAFNSDLTAWDMVSLHLFCCFFSIFVVYFYFFIAFLTIIYFYIIN